MQPAADAENSEETSLEKDGVVITIETQDLEGRGGIDNTRKINSCMSNLEAWQSQLHRCRLTAE